MAATNGISLNHHFDSDDNDDIFFPPNHHYNKSDRIVHFQSQTLTSNHVALEVYSNSNGQVDCSNDDYLKSKFGEDNGIDGISSTNAVSHRSLRQQESISPPDTPSSEGLGRLRQGSIVDGLLHEIYDRWHFVRQDSFDSDTLTECSSTSEFLWHGRSEYPGGFDGGYQSSVRRETGALNRSFLQSQSEYCNF